MCRTPEGYRPDNLLGNIVDVISDRSGLEPAEVATRVASSWGDGDYGCAEDAIWTMVGPLIDSVQDRAGIEWA